VKVSEFHRAVADEFGPFGRVLVRDTVVVALGNRTAEAALEAGVPAREVWLALCRAEGVPPSRWYGVGRPDPGDG
jgi:uroporphyrinogen-III synthase